MSANTQETDKRKAPKTTFKKGQSGNPSGCPREDPEELEILKAALAEVARKLVELAQNEDPKIALPACREILDRTQGKSGTTGRIQVSGGIDLELSVKKRVLALARKLAMEADEGQADASDSL